MSGSRRGFGDEGERVHLCLLHGYRLSWGTGCHESNFRTWHAQACAQCVGVDGHTALAINHEQHWVYKGGWQKCNPELEKEELDLFSTNEGVRAEADKK